MDNESVRDDSADRIKAALGKIASEKNVRNLIVAGRQFRLAGDVYLSYNCDRLALPISGVHQQKLASDKEVLLVSPECGDMIWMPSGSWNRPNWILPVETLTMMLFPNAIRIHLVKHPGGPFSVKDAVTAHRWEVDYPSHMIRCLQTIRNNGTPPECMPYLLHVIVKMVWKLLQEGEDSDLRTPPSSGERTWTRMVDYMEANLTKDLSREDLAGIFHVSPNHVSRLFRQYGKNGFAEVLTRLRLEHACELLRMPTMKVKEVAAASGFRDANYFGRVFRKRYGCSPGVYRRSN